MGLMHSRDLAMADDAISGEADLLVSVSRPRWRTIRRVLLFGSVAIFYLAMLFFVLRDLLDARSMTVFQPALLLGLVGLFGFGSLIKVVLIWFSLKLPLEIFKSGIAFQGVKPPWKAVEGCRWGRYTPGTLEVRIRRTRLYFPIPRGQRDTVEASLRDLGKWQC
jgi:hypothetical protein